MQSQSSLPGSSSAPILYHQSLDELMEFDDDRQNGQLLSNESCQLFNQSHFAPNSVSQNTQNNFCSDPLPNNLFNSTRFSDRDSGVNSQENLSEVFPESALNCEPNTGPKDLDWLSLEQDPFSLI